MSKRYQLAIKNPSLHGDKDLSLAAIGLVVHLHFEEKRSPHRITTAEQILNANPSNDLAIVVAALEELKTAGYIKEVA